MKIRRGFVTNSSSSSYVCCYCGAAEGGYDLSISDTGMYECEEGHVICRSHCTFSEEDLYNYLKDLIINKLYRCHDAENGLDLENHKLAEYIEEIRTNLKDLEEKRKNGMLESFAETNYDFEYELPHQFCPICSFQELSNLDGFRYLMKKTGLSTKEILGEIKQNFKTYGDFKEYLRND